MNRPYFENQPQKVFVMHKYQSYPFKTHFHGFIELAYCFYGIQLVKIGDTVYELKAGDAAVIFPNTVHEYLPYEGEACPETESISVMCNLNFLSETFPEIINSYPINPFIPANDTSEKLALACRKITETQNSAELIGWAYIILSLLLASLSYTTKKGYSDIKLPSLITSYINDNFAEPLTINFIAKKFGYSPSYIAHLFCDQLKIPFKTYLNSVRCDFAEKELRTTKKSITEIAHLAGYSSLNTFSRCFKNHTGKTPTEFKNMSAG